MQRETNNKPNDLMESNIKKETKKEKKKKKRQERLNKFIQFNFNYS